MRLARQSQVGHATQFVELGLLYGIGVDPAPLSIALLYELDFFQFLEGFGELLSGLCQLRVEIADRRDQVLPALDRRLGEGGIGVVIEP